MELVKISVTFCLVIGHIHLLLAIRSYQFTPNLLSMYELSIKSQINTHYAYTTVIKRLENKGGTEQNITYSVLFPEKAFVSNFVLEIDDKNYTAFLTRRIENESNEVDVTTNNHVKALAERDSNRFTFPITVKPKTKVAFYLKYEQMLERENSRYEHVINIQTDQIIPDFNIEVDISETNSLTNLNSTIRICGEDQCKDVPIKKNELSKRTNNATVIKPDLSENRQFNFTRLIKSNKAKGFLGQFVVQYDTEGNLKVGSVVINNGYCIYSFLPKGLPQLSKYVIFILDTSLSMEGRKLNLLKHAMTNIIGNLHNNDLFSIVEFNNNVKVWNLDGSVVYYPSKGGLIDLTKEADLKNFRFSKAHRVNAINIGKAKKIISKLKTKGNTDMYNALKVGLYLVELSRNVMKRATPFIIFLTDGEPVTQYQISKHEIVEKISNYNNGLRRSSIFTLAFGTEPDYQFLEELAKRNGGYLKQIYDAYDASTQLQSFFQQISTPVLTNVTFHFEPTVTNLTQTRFSTLFSGMELVVGGYCGANASSNVTVYGWNDTGKQNFTDFAFESTQTDIKRSWVYIKISQLLDESVKEEEDQVNALRKAYDLALANSFTTYLTSLVVPLPNNSVAVVNPHRPRKDISTVSFPGHTPAPFGDVDNLPENLRMTSSVSHGTSNCLFSFYLLLLNCIIATKIFIFEL